MQLLFMVAIAIAGLVYGYYERKKRRRQATEDGGYPVRTGQFMTGLFECCGLPRICCPATFFTPILAAFNRAEVDNRDCHFCDAFFSMKTPITQYQTRQSLRSEHKLADAPVSDCFAALCCTPCAVAQDTIELERRKATHEMVSTVAVTIDQPPAYAVQTSVPLESVMKEEYSQVPVQCQV
jgi:Cys-rich protein (TIGR01571 family)